MFRQVIGAGTIEGKGSAEISVKTGCPVVPNLQASAPVGSVREATGLHGTSLNDESPEGIEDVTEHG